MVYLFFVMARHVPSPKWVRARRLVLAKLLATQRSPPTLGITACLAKTIVN